MRRRLRPQQLESRQLLAANIFHNEAMPEDVNEDGQVSSLDALMVINEVGRQGRDGDGVRERGRGRMTDVNNDGRDTAADALMVINLLGRQARPGTNDGNGSTDPIEQPTEPTDQRASDRPDSDGVDANQNETDRANPQLEGDAVLAWNDVFSELLIAEESKQNPGYASRSMAMLNLAIYDAVSLAAGNPDDAFYDYDISIDTNSNLKAEVVASQAAYTVLSSLYSDQQEMIDHARDRILGRGARPNAENEASLNLGTEIGNAIVAARANDGFDGDVEYVYGNDPGDFQPDPLNPDVPVWGPAWGEVETFSITSVDDFTPETTPPLDSAEYAASYNEVLELGSVDSTTRTADQTEAGIFWAYDRVGLGTPMALFNDVLETIAIQEENTFAENAALYAQASVAMADAGVVAWQTKFSEQFWRPVTAIQAGDTDGNPLTEADADWTALGAPDGGDDIIGFTPQFPTYVSGHATFGGALFGAIREFYGTDEIAFELTSRELEIIMENPELEAAYGLDLDDAVRSFDSLSEAMAENGRSRVYLGIHFDFDDLVGQEVGQAVATSVSSEFVVPQLDDGGGRPGGPDRGPDQNPDRRDPLPQPNRPDRPEDQIARRDALDQLLGSDEDMGQQQVNEDDLERLAQDQMDRGRSRGGDRNGNGAGQIQDDDDDQEEETPEDLLTNLNLV